VFIFIFPGQPQNKASARRDPVYDSRFAKTKTSECVVRLLDAIQLVDVKTPIH
jgi:hypothetical protein